MSVLDKIKDMCVKMDLISIYDTQCHSVPQFLYYLQTKINDVIQTMNGFGDEVIEQLKIMSNEIEYLLNNGVEKEVTKQLEKWLDSGVIADILNKQIFDELNYKVDNNQNSITNIMKKLEVNVFDFGATGNGVTDDITAIQNAVDAVAVEGGIVNFSQGRYLISKPIFLPSNVTLKGEGSRVTYLEKIKGGITVLDENIDYSTLDRDDLIKYDSAIVIESDGSYFNIKGFSIKSNDIKNKSKFGIFSNKIQLFTFEDLVIEYFDEGFRTMNAWNVNLKSIRVIHTTYGIRLEDARPNEYGASTSWVMDRVFSEYTDYAYKFRAMQYSSLNGICADQVNKRAYWFDYCQGISVNGMGCENSTCQIIKCNFSQVSVNGFFFLATKPIINKPSEMTSNSLIEVTNVNRLGCGLILNSGEFKTDTSGLTKLYGSFHATINCYNVRVWDGKPLMELDTENQAKVTFDTFDEIKTNKKVQVNDVKLDKISSGYKTNNYDHYTNVTIYNDVQDNTTVNSISIPLSELAKNFDWVTSTDNYMWLPLKISVSSEWHGSCNHIWGANNSITSTNKISFGTDFVDTIIRDGNNLKINFNKAVARVKVVISLA